MSTYTDLHNRVKESLTVDYHSRITPQVISALNSENEFWGTFRGKFVGDCSLSSISATSIYDSEFIRGRQLSSVMDSPKLFLSVDEESGEDVIQDLTAYIAEHGSSGVSSVISGVTLLDSILAECSISADGTVSSLVDYIKAHDDGELARAISAWLDGRFALSESVLSAKDSALAVNALSVAFDRVCDLNEVPLSALLKDLADKDTVLDVCVRVNDIISLAELAVEPLDFETCSCGDLFTAVRGIAGDEGIASFGEAVASLNAALHRLVAKNRSLESRLSFLMRRIDDIIVLANRLSADLVREIMAGDSAVLSDVRLSAVEFWKAAKATEERVDGRISNEISRAMAAEAGLSERIDRLRLSAVTTQELAAEVAARKAADEGLSLEIAGLLNSLSGYYEKTETSSAVEIAGKFAELSTYSEIHSRLSCDGYLTDKSFTSAQTSAIDSGITSVLVHNYNTHIANRGVHVLSSDKQNWNGKYNKPSGGIPKSDLDSSVRASLGKADTALQEHQSLDGYATEEWVKDQGYLSAHQSLSGYATEGYVRQEVSAENERAMGVESGLDIRLNDISGKIDPTAPSTSASSIALAGAKTTAEFVNSSINNFAAFYITKTAGGDAFQTKADLLSATVFYNAGAERKPTKNDYCIVLADESKRDPEKTSAPTTRYSWQGKPYPEGQWEFQYEVNNTAFTQKQIAALDSGITSGTVTQVTETKNRVDSLVQISTNHDGKLDGLIQVSADHESRIGGLEMRSAAAMMLSGGEFGGGVSFEKDEADLSVCFTDVIDFDAHVLSDFLKPLAESVTVFGVCVRINDMIRLSSKGIEPVPYDTTDIEDVFGTVKELTGVEPTDIGSVRVALNRALAVLTLGDTARTLEGRFRILSKRDDGVVQKVDALSAEIAKGSALAEVSAFLSGEIGKKADSVDLTAYALSADVMPRSVIAGRFDGVNVRIDSVLAKLKGVYDALSGLPENPAEFNLIENVAPALIALRSALSAFA